LGKALAEIVGQVVFFYGSGPSVDIQGGKGFSIVMALSGFVKVDEDGVALSGKDDVAGVKVHVVDSQGKKGVHLGSKLNEDGALLFFGKGGRGQGVIVGDGFHKEPTGSKEAARFDEPLRDRGVHRCP